MRVLYVEDDTTLGQTVERMLLLEGYSCHWATTGEEAVQLGQDNDYDVILLYIGLPDIDGYEVISRLLDLEISKPFLIQSGLIPRDKPGDELGFGVDDFLIKPFNRKELIRKALSSVLGQSYVNWELIVVDDGSTDGTDQLQEDYNDPRICWVTQPRILTP